MSAVNLIGESTLSVFRTILFSNVPSAPVSLTLSAAIEPSLLTASWTAPVQVNGDAVRGYRVYVDDGFGGPFT